MSAIVGKHSNMGRIICTVQWLSAALCKGTSAPEFHSPTHSSSLMVRHLGSKVDNWSDNSTALGINTNNNIIANLNAVTCSSVTTDVAVI
jgi:hypothetical protein